MFVYRPAYVFHRRRDAKPSIAASLIFFSSSPLGHGDRATCIHPSLLSAGVLSDELGMGRAMLRAENHLPGKVEIWGRDTCLPLPTPSRIVQALDCGGASPTTGPAGVPPLL